MKTKYPTWWPEKPPVYDIKKTYAENFSDGPQFKELMPKRALPDSSHCIDFLGYKIASPIGVPAGPLLDSNWISFAAQMGFDVLTYKTIRSEFHLSHPLPNVAYVDAKGQITKDRLQETLRLSKKIPQNLENIAVTNSFGMPSQNSHFLLQDIEKANRSLSPGQVMIVSIVGTPNSDKDFIDDFVETASLAKEAGAQIIEANFSCPNVTSCEGSLYTNPDGVLTMSSALKKAIGSIPLIIKIGPITEEKLLKDVMENAVRGGAAGICGINTVSMKIVDEKGAAALGDNRLHAGICGSPIRETALNFTRLAYKINKEQKFGLKILATGGVMVPEHFDHFLESGADVAMSAVGMMWDPYLAMRYHESGEKKWKN